MPYDPQMVQPMRDELAEMGVKELTTPEEVDSVLREKSGTTLVLVNSVCGCAAGMARPGLRSAMSGEARPDRVVSVFAGQDVDATARARSYFPDVPPSSPSFALFKEGHLAHFVPRHMIEGREATNVADDLRQAFEEHCA